MDPILRRSSFFYSSTSLSLYGAAWPVHADARLARVRGDSRCSFRSGSSAGCSQASTTSGTRSCACCPCRTRGGQDQVPAHPAGRRCRWTLMLGGLGDSAGRRRGRRVTIVYVTMASAPPGCFWCAATRSPSGASASRRSPPSSGCPAPPWGWSWCWTHVAEASSPTSSGPPSVASPYRMARSRAVDLVRGMARARRAGGVAAADRRRHPASKPPARRTCSATVPEKRRAGTIGAIIVVPPTREVA